jgi:hypothetical protein
LLRTAEGFGGASWLRLLASNSAIAFTIPRKTRRKTFPKKKLPTFASGRGLISIGSGVIRKIIAFDLELIENHADYLICYWDSPGAQSGGTSAELTVAHRKGIPVYLVTPLPLEQISGWMLGCSDHVFASVEQLKEFLVVRFAQKKQTQPWKD